MEGGTAAAGASKVCVSQGRLFISGQQIILNPSQSSHPLPCPLSHPVSFVTLVTLAPIVARARATITPCHRRVSASVCLSSQVHHLPPFRTAHTAPHQLIRRRASRIHPRTNRKPSKTTHQQSQIVLLNPPIFLQWPGWVLDRSRENVQEVPRLPYHFLAGFL